MIGGSIDSAAYQINSPLWDTCPLNCYTVKILDEIDTFDWEEYEDERTCDSGEIITVFDDDELIKTVLVGGDCGSYVRYEFNDDLSLIPVEIGPKVDLIAIREWSTLAKNYLRNEGY